MRFFALFLSLLLVIVVVARARSKSRMKRPSAPACGACGYLVAGLTTLTCPECGSDLGRMGIVTNRTAPSIGLTSVLLVWTAALIVLGGAVSLAIYADLPRLRGQRTTLTLQSRGPAGSVDIALDGWQDGAVARFETATLRRLAGNRVAGAPLTVDLQSMIPASPWHGGGAGAAHMASSGRAIADWMAAGGIDVTKPEVRVAALELHHRLVHLAAAGGLGPSNGSTSSSAGLVFRTVNHSGSFEWRGRPAAVIAWLALWAPGALWLAGLARRRAAWFTDSGATKGAG